MEARAYLKHVRISPRKVKIVCDLIRGKEVGVAAAILMNTPKAASEPMLKLLKSAAANAENNHNMNTDALYVDQVLRVPRPRDEESSSPRPGQSVPHPQKDIAHHDRPERKRIRAGGKLWARKSIPTVCAWA